MVTHTKLMDSDIERKLSYINDHIDNNHLWLRINRLTLGPIAIETKTFQNEYCIDKAGFNTGL